MRDAQRIKKNEEELKEKYSVDNLFKNRQKAKEDEILQQNIIVF